ncbi:uricase-like [Drosophila nasuta]|uniref:uricase-like n=1 Tax=Drosophila nasuta TaxID=42062 RepID=UPI00295EDF4E|nr:uricase-like [Drosophila nasuta]XP_060650855.1 uricase-like [Drosophila nasuta]
MIAAPLRSPTSPTEDKKLPYNLTGKGYGKDGVKLFHVTRDGAYHSVQEFDIKVHIKLSGNKEYTEGENSEIVDSDALRNIICVLGKKQGIEGPEKFALLVARKALEQYAHIVEISLNVETYPWRRISQDKTKPDGSTTNYQHNHAFMFTSTAQRYCEVIVRRQDAKPTVISGFKGLRLLKTTKSTFLHFIEDEYTTTPQLHDRMLSTIAEGAWEYSDFENVDFTKDWESVTETVVKTFGGDPIDGTVSTSTQRTSYLSIKQVLDDLPHVAVMSLTLPNRHYVHFDMKPFKKLVPGENNEIFIPLDKPYGIVYTQLSRKDLKSHY